MDVGEEEEVPLDDFEKAKAFKVAWDEKPAPKEVVEGQIYNERAIGGNRNGNKKLEQFLCGVNKHVMWCGERGTRLGR